MFYAKGEKNPWPLKQFLMGEETSKVSICPKALECNNHTYSVCHTFFVGHLIELSSLKIKKTKLFCFKINHSFILYFLKYFSLHCNSSVSKNIIWSLKLGFNKIPMCFVNLQNCMNHNFFFKTTLFSEARWGRKFYFASFTRGVASKTEKPGFI